MKIQKSWSKAVVLALGVMPSFAWAQKNWNAPPIVATYCSGCHGVDGNSQLPYFPKLGGLDATYAEKKLTEFKEPPSPPVDEMFSWLAKVAGGKKNTSNATQAERVNMEGVAHAANPEIIKEAVLWYAKQPPAPGHSSNESLIVAGKDLFLHGIPAQKLLACTTCHGADAQGTGKAPRLAGQNAAYMEGQLVKFRKGDRSHAPEMTVVTRDLDPEQARAVAAYLQSL